MADSLGGDAAPPECLLSGSVQKTFMVEYLLGNVFSLMIGSATLVLCLQYLDRKRDDRRLFRITMAVLTVCTLAQLIMCLCDSTSSFALGFGNLAKATSNGPFYGGMLMMCGINGFVVQAFYAHRCFRVLNNNYWAGGIIGLSALWSLGSWLYVWNILIGPSDTELYETIGWLQGLGLIASIVTDALCFIILVVGLHLAAKKSGGAGQAGFAKSGAFRRLLTLAVTTNAMTTVVNVATYICFLKNTGGDIVLEPSIPHLYTLTLICWLGARGKVKATGITTNVNKTFTQSRPHRLTFAERKSMDDSDHMTLSHHSFIPVVLNDTERHFDDNSEKERTSPSRSETVLPVFLEPKGHGRSQSAHIPRNPPLEFDRASMRSCQ